MNTKRLPYSKMAKGSTVLSKIDTTANSKVPTQFENPIHAPRI